METWRAFIFLSDLLGPEGEETLGSSPKAFSASLSFSN